MYNETQAAQAKMAADQHARAGLTGRDFPPPPRDPCVREKVQEILSFLAETEASLGKIRESIFGPVPESNEALGKLISMAIHRAAQLASEARSISERL
jgi:hypothetical protein